MNILFVNDFPFPGAGGVGRVTETLAEEFVKIGHKVTYLALKEGKNYTSNNIVQNFIPDNVYSEKGCVDFVKDYLSNQMVDLIINQGGSKPDVIKIITRANMGRAVLFSVHHNCVSCLLKNYKNILSENYRGSRFLPFIRFPVSFLILKFLARIKLAYYFRRAIGKSDKFILLSDSFVPELVSLTKLRKSEKLVGIPNPAPFQAVPGIEEMKENRIIFVGRVNMAQKRVDLLIKIWKHIYKKFPDWSLDIVGDGPDLQKLKRESKEQKLQGIFFHGYCDPKPFLEKAKIFLMTSAFEGYPMVLVEAQAYGVIPFAFHTFSALPDIIDDKKNGVIIPPYDINKYLEELSLLMEDEKERASMAISAQKAIDRYKPSHITRLWLDLYHDYVN